MTRAKVLVIDDKENMLKLFERILSADYDVTTLDDGARALGLIAAQAFDVIITDLKMPEVDGFRVLDAAKARSQSTEVIMMTAYASVQDAVTAMKRGVYDYLQKPFDPDEAALLVARAVERRQLKEQAASLRRELQGVHAFDSLVGKSSAMQDAYRLLQRAAEIEITVLITGETGTGKEVAARAIHYQGTRKDQRFVTINCGALPAELAESELFGHCKGAFTGASSNRAGLFEEANGGTLFLDEIGELPLAVQVKLNRALQERQVRRVGNNVSMPVDVRVIAATHRDLKAEIKAGSFREDLYYRLHVFPVSLPPLRDRREDIPLLAVHFLNKHGHAFRRDLHGFTPQALRALTSYAWPGNVRELQNAVERAVAITTGPDIDLHDLPPETHAEDATAASTTVHAEMSYRQALETTRERASRDYFTALLQAFGGNVTRAAARAGVERESLHRLLKRYGLHADDFKKT